MKQWKIKVVPGSPEAKAVVKYIRELTGSVFNGNSPSYAVDEIKNIADCGPLWFTYDSFPEITFGQFQEIAGIMSFKEFKQITKIKQITKEKPKEMSNEFCVNGGSVAIREAFIKDLAEVGIIGHADIVSENWPQNKTFLVPYRECNNYCAYNSISRGTVYTLPTDYEIALKAFKALKRQNKQVVINSSDAGGDSNSFSVVVWKDKIEVEGASVSIDDIKNLVKTLKETKIMGIYGWEVNIDCISVGCKKNIPIADLKKIIQTAKDL